MDRITIQQLKPEICIRKQRQTAVAALIVVVLVSLVRLRILFLFVLVSVVTFSDVEATNSSGASVCGPVILRPMQASILIVLRNTQTHLELCVFCKRPDLSTGLSESLGLVEGHFDGEGKLGGPCAALLERHMNLTLYRDDCVDLLSAAHGKTVGHAGVLCCPTAATTDAAAAVRTQLLLYRSTATPEVLQKLEQEIGRTKRHGFQPATVGSAQQAADLGLR